MSTLNAYVLITTIGALSLLSSLAWSASPEDFWLGYQVSNPSEFEAVTQINVWGVSEHQSDNLLDVIKSVINRVLGILALICLILVIYGGILMVTSAGNEEQYTKGWKILRAAAIGILLIGVARFIISLIFRLSQQVGRAAEWSTAGTDQ